MNSPLAAISQGVVVNFLATLATVIAGIVTARGLGVGGRGIVAALIALPTFVSFVATAGLPSALIYEARKNPSAASPLFGAALLLGLMIGLIATAATWLYTPRMLATLPANLVATGRLLAAFAFAGILSNVGVAALQAAGEFSACNAIRLTQPLLQLAGLAALGACGQLEPVPIAILTLASGLPGLLWSLAWMARRQLPQLSELAGATRRLTHYASRAAGGELVVGMTSQIDKVIVVGLFAPEALGLYVVAMSLSRVLAIIPSAVVPVLFPSTAGRAECEVMNLTSRAAAMTALCVAAGALALGALGPWLLSLFYGAEFAHADVAFRLLLAEAAVSAVAQVLAQAFMALNRPVLAGLQQTLGVAVAIALLYALAPHWGISGAALALLIAAMVRLASIYGCFTVIGTGMPQLTAHLGPNLLLLRDMAANRLPTRFGWLRP
ncbi:MAG: oligosaccharide flippase family protein [Pseudomonadota bacterium]